jgi:molecular chaperone GrpE
LHMKDESIESLKVENERLKDDLLRAHDIYLRSVADFDNYRKRIERERASADQEGNRELILSLLNVLDDFGYALKHVTESPASVSEGLYAIHRRLAKVLEKQGVTSFESVGHLFDPALHEAVVSEEVNEIEPGTVLDELSKGYRWGDKLLRPARVRVAR